jgi:predicted  nucleic acid-binding Zn-ribbon protein
LVGGVGYWGWSRTDDHVVRQLADEEQRRVAAEKVAEAAEITAAQALLDKHIAVEEAEAQARARSSVQDQNKRTTVNR